MTILLILATFIFAIIFDMFVIHKRKKIDKKSIFFEDIFYSPKIGLTMRDGGKPIKKDNK